MSAHGLFPRALGAAYERLPAIVRAAHAGREPVGLEGRARARGHGGAAALARRLQGLPAPGLHAVAVTITPTPEGETWTRRFSGKAFRSRIKSASGDPAAFEESVGLLTFRFHARPHVDGFSWVFEAWRLGALPLPAAWAPLTRATTSARDGRYRFRVLIAHRWLGVVFAYAGWLALRSEAAEGAAP